MIITIINSKGGVGKTTTALGLGEALAKMPESKRVLIIDLDHQASASLALGLSRHELSPSMAEVFLDDLAMDAIIRKTALDNLYLAPGSDKLTEADMALAQASSGWAKILYAALEPIKSKYDYILIDCPPSFNSTIINALVAANRLLIPIEPHYLAMEGWASLRKRLLEIKDRMNLKLEILGIVLTRVDRRTSLTNEVADFLKDRFSAAMFETEIPTNIKLAEAPSHGLTIAEYAPTSRGAQAYGLLAEEVVTRTTRRAANV